ncbi:VOC family protein [Cyanobium sp. Candia 9D4]|uniref:VOC family protein n=1 Tax=Cyanobium sp. Candia 9D4 TaxID=2823707 RepID=UPI0020CF9D1B|nr:VOC family protein [Cyanobium sp. Candia 9D4]MCP9933597.1 VOC family protein [Cyanobium sp. Candia 9D4]
MAFTRLLTNLCSDRLAESRDFYVSLLGFKVNYDSDWYVQLRSPSHPELELGIIARSHDLVPATFQQTPTGMYLTFVVPDVDALHARAMALGLAILQEPRNEFYGQRRFLTVDPNGCLIDICSPC